ncbi:ATP-binding protein [Herbaspirillum seropedicae]|uniref:ATP-binding protein n=1 Tax=Herbaspirillum seropedicae TaxID=964 RepID=UPI001C60E05D|nr:ATP-binding protein [Herbaspirillum seropedicae]
MKSAERKSKSASDGKGHSSATLRSTSGAGFEFEDLISAWHMVKALSGERAPGIDSVVTQIQAQVSTLGWHIDDLLLTSRPSGGVRQLAMSVKGNFQVTAAGLPSDFVVRAWKQWRDTNGPFNRATDGLALITLGTHQIFAPAWREIKNACSGMDAALAISRIRLNKKQSVVFDSVKTPGNATDEQTIELIRCLHVFPSDLQFVPSENETYVLSQCRGLLESGTDAEAHDLWTALINVAKEVRLRSGTVTVPSLLSSLRGKFGLRNHPDFVRDWATLSNITADYKIRIETELPTGYIVPRTAETEAFRAAVASNAVTVVFGESGSGKSALVKSVLDSGYPTWNQVWFGPDELKDALSAARRGTLPLVHELSLVLNATVKHKNVLVIDSAERIDSREFIVIRQLIQAILPVVAEQIEQSWRIVVITQTQSWNDGGDSIINGRKSHIVEVGILKSEAVKSALSQSSSLSWLVAHDETIAALTNLRTLAWVIKAGVALEANAGKLASHTAIADSLWKHWTQGQVDVQSLVMRLAQREASFERSFPLTEMSSADTVTFTQRPAALPLRLNERTNCIEFEHDLAADWARFQFLKQIQDDTSLWSNLATNPLWTNALRMLGQFLLRQQSGTSTAWDAAFEAAVGKDDQLAGDILLDSLCLDSDAERFLTERADLLLANHGAHFSRLLLRFHHIATVPSGLGSGVSTAVGLYLDIQYRSIVFGRWSPVLRFIVAQRERLANMTSSALAKVIRTWLTKTPHTLNGDVRMPFRREMAEIALAMVRNVQVEKGHGVMYLMDDLSLYTAPLAGISDLPTEVGNWALELAGRKEPSTDVAQRISEINSKKARDHKDRLLNDAQYKARHEERKRSVSALSSFRERSSPWPLGARKKIDRDFREACIKEHGIQFLMRDQPQIASEILLALTIENQPERTYGSRAYEIDLGLEYVEGVYPTAFWKSPFFHFLQIAPDTAITSLIALVNFCTERWAAAIEKEEAASAPSVTLTLSNGSEKKFLGGWRVFCWHQSNDSIHNGSLYCALDALERWLTSRIDSKEDISSVVERILQEGNSTAFVSVLVNLAKYRPSLLKGSLEVLITYPDIFYWDAIRVDKIDFNFSPLSWANSGQAMFELARDWTLAPHRTLKFLDVVVARLLDDSEIAQRLQTLLETWALPEDRKEALEFRYFFAQLNRINYQTTIDPVSGTKTHSFACPELLRQDMAAWNAEVAPARSYLLMPGWCEDRLTGRQLLTDDEASALFKLLIECDEIAESEGSYDKDAKWECRFATAGTLIALGGDWIAKNHEAQMHALNVLRASVASVATTSEDIQERRIGGLRNDLKFVAYAVMHLWLTDSEGTAEWEAAVLCLLTSGDNQAASVVIGVAYSHREQLGTVWWRLVFAGLFWSGLTLLAPRHGEDERDGRVWTSWLSRLRRFPLSGVTATPDNLDFARIVLGKERLHLQRQLRIYNSSDKRWGREPKRGDFHSLDGRFLEKLFAWLIDGEGTGDRRLDTQLVLRIWDYDVTRAKLHEKGEHGEYGMLSQNLGYDILLKLGALSLAAPHGEARKVWEEVLSHGPAAHYALKHFISGFFMRLGKGDDPISFERVWRDMVEYALSADWSQPGLWFHGERLIGDLLGFGHAAVLSPLNAGAALRMKDVYERWASTHLVRDEENINRFSYFLTTAFGAPLRLEGLRWIAMALKKIELSRRWRRDTTGDALVELCAVALESDSQLLSHQKPAREALFEIVAELAGRRISAALVLQQRITQMR